MRYQWGRTGDDRRDVALFLGLTTMILGSYYGPHYVWALGAVVFFGAVFVWYPVVRALARGRERVSDLAVEVPSLRERLSGVLGGSGDTEGGEDDPLERLRERYAAGELSQREFEERLEELLAEETADSDEERAVERELATETE